MKDHRLYARFVQDFPDDPKIRPLSDAAFRCWVEGICWSRQHMTDGVLPKRLALARWSLEALTELCANDDTNPSFVETETSWLIHDYGQHQDTKADMLARREQARSAGQRGGLAKAKRSAKRNAKRTDSGALSEHVPKEEETFVSPNGLTHSEMKKGGVARAREPEPPEPPQPDNAPTPEPPEFCPRHPDGTDAPCAGCQAARRRHENWFAQQTVQAKQNGQAQARARRAAIDDCPACDDNGMRETPHGLTRCTHTTDDRWPIYDAEEPAW